MGPADAPEDRVNFRVRVDLWGPVDAKPRRNACNIVLNIEKNAALWAARDLEAADFQRPENFPKAAASFLLHKSFRDMTNFRESKANFLPRKNFREVQVSFPILAFPLHPR